MPILEEIHMHEQCFSAAGGALQAEFIQVIQGIWWNVFIIRSMTVKAIHEFIQVEEQSLTIIKVTIKIDLDK